MNRIQAKELLPIIQAFAEGKPVLYRLLGDERWEEATTPAFNVNMYEYRLKLEPEYKYRPFANAEECWEEMQKHQPFGWVKAYHGQFVITEIRDSKAIIGRNNNFMDYDYILENYTFADGTPFGLKNKR